MKDFDFISSTKELFLVYLNLLGIEILSFHILNSSTANVTVLAETKCKEPKSRLRYIKVKKCVGMQQQRWIDWLLCGFLEGFYLLRFRYTRRFPCTVLQD